MAIIGFLLYFTARRFKNNHTRILTKAVSFYAILTKDVSPSLGEVIVFDHILTNQGSAYNPRTGIFTATHHALHHFTLSYHSNGCDTELSLVHNTATNPSCIATAGNYDAGECSVAMEIYPGDTVHVEASHSNEGCVRGDYHATSHLTGKLLHLLKDKKTNKKKTVTKSNRS